LAPGIGHIVHYADLLADLAGEMRHHPEHALEHHELGAMVHLMLLHAEQHAEARL
jgi:hypothetical protein